ncbi:PGC-1 and ERR-induced regulator in muscle protein 1 isoform X6 [Zonotrichia albicollis]|uniref:PGC-1 and ERR-induced regulator in muscle protein 1 isoform X6 n=1 Tax=Zonotrichia albicollis TaxID=44394 RepID=UPI003D81232C
MDLGWSWALCPGQGRAPCAAGRALLWLLHGPVPTRGWGTGMDNFEYSIQLTDREWAEFLRAAEECSLAPASLATAEEQSLSDIEQGDSGGRGSAAGPGSEPAAPGSANPATRGARAGASRPERGQCCVPGSERGAEPGRSLCDSDSHQPGCAAAMPSAQRRQQPPRAPGGTAQGTAGTAPAGMEQGGDAGGTQAPLAQPEAPAAPGAPSEPPVAAQQQQQDTAGTEPSVAAQQDPAGTEPSSPGGSPSVVRPKVPAQPRKSRKQRGAEGEREPPSAAPPGKAPPGSPASPRKGRAKDKAARAALVRLGSEEGGDGGPKAPGRTKGTRAPKAAQAGASGGRDTVPAVPADGAAALPGEESQEMPGKPLQPRNVAALGGNAAEGAGGQPADETPGIPAAEIPGIPAAEIPAVPAAELPKKPSETPGIPAAEIPRKPSEIPAVPAAGIPWEPAAAIPRSPAIEIPTIPAAGIPNIPAIEIPRTPAAEISRSAGAGIPRSPAIDIPRSPAIDIPRSPAIAIPRSPAIAIPRSPAIDIPRSPAVDIPRIPAAELPRIPAIEIPCDPAAGLPWEAAAELPRAVSPLCFAEGASGKPNSLDVTWPEMYEYLFCDSQEEEELGSSLEGRKSPLQREISWPELYEYFFTEPEGSRKKGKAKDRKRKKFRGLERPGLHQEAPSRAPDKDTVVISVPDVHERFFPEPAPNRMGWRGIFSLAPASEVKKAVRALGSLLQRQAQLGGGQAPGSQALVPRRSGEELALVPLGGAQGWPEDEDRALALRGAAEEQPRVLSHKDMCLVFCAFASWAVKTSDLQAPDAWKTMFLASFGTLSAIRYFRRTVREGHPRT